MKINILIQWRIQDLPDDGANPKGMPAYYPAKFDRKLHQNEENLTKRGRGRPSRHINPPIVLIIFNTDVEIVSFITYASISSKTY